MSDNETPDHAKKTRVDSEASDQTSKNLPVEMTEAELMRVEATTTSLVDKLIDELSPLVEAGIDAFTEDRERKDQIQKLHIDAEHEAVKRHSWLLGGVIVAIFGLSLAALLMRELDFAELVLGSALAVAAGAGLSAMIGKKKG